MPARCPLAFTCSSGGTFFANRLPNILWRLLLGRRTTVVRHTRSVSHTGALHCSSLIAPCRSAAQTDSFVTLVRACAVSDTRALPVGWVVRASCVGAPSRVHTCSLVAAVAVMRLLGQARGASRRFRRDRLARGHPLPNPNSQRAGRAIVWLCAERRFFVGAFWSARCARPACGCRVAAKQLKQTPFTPSAGPSRVPEAVWTAVLRFAPLPLHGCALGACPVRRVVSPLGKTAVVALLSHVKCSNWDGAARAMLFSGPCASCVWLSLLTDPCARVFRAVCVAHAAGPNVCKATHARVSAET